MEIILDNAIYDKGLERKCIDLLISEAERSIISSPMFQLLKKIEGCSLSPELEDKLFKLLDDKFQSIKKTGENSDFVDYFRVASSCMPYFQNLQHLLITKRMFRLASKKTIRFSQLFKNRSILANASALGNRVKVTFKPGEAVLPVSAIRRG